MSIYGVASDTRCIIKISFPGVENQLASTMLCQPRKIHAFFQRFSSRSPLFSWLYCSAIVYRLSFLFFFSFFFFVSSTNRAEGYERQCFYCDHSVITGFPSPAAFFFLRELISSLLISLLPPYGPTQIAAHSSPGHRTIVRGRWRPEGRNAASVSFFFHMTTSNIVSAITRNLLHDKEKYYYFKSRFIDRRSGDKFNT